MLKVNKLFSLFATEVCERKQVLRVSMELQKQNCFVEQWPLGLSFHGIFRSTKRSHVFQPLECA